MDLSTTPYVRLLMSNNNLYTSYFFGFGGKLNKIYNYDGFNIHDVCRYREITYNLLHGYAWDLYSHK